MPQYIQNPTTGEQTTLEEKKFGTLQNAANAGYSPITADSLKPVPAIDLPEEPTNNIGVGVLEGGQAAIDYMQKQGVERLKTSQTEENSIEQMMKNLLSGEAPTDPTIAYNEAYNQANIGGLSQDVVNKQAKVKSAQSEFDVINAQLQGITAEAQAQNLALEGQARDTGTTATTATFLNRQQNEVNRQAAIKALPLQAQALIAQAKISSAQGDVDTANQTLAIAQSKFDTVFKLKSDYATQVYNYKKEQRDRIFDYLTTKEKQRLDRLQKEDDQKYQEGRDNLNLAQSWVAEAMKVGLPDVASKLTQLDENSLTFRNDLAALQGEVVKKQSELPGEQFTLSEGQTRYDSQGNIIAEQPKELNELEKLSIEEKKINIQQKLKDLEGTGELDTKTVTQVDKISSSFDSSPIVKNFNEVQNKKLSIDEILSRGTGPSDLAAIFDFMKSLDPTSVVRESEYEAASKSGNVLLGGLARFNGLFKEGGQKLPQSVRDEFSGILQDKFEAVQKQYKNLRSEKARLINQKTGSDDGLDYLIDYDFSMSKPASLEDYYQSNPDKRETVERMINENPNLSDDEILQILDPDFNGVGGDTNKAVSKAITVPDGKEGGQCGRFVNKYTGLNLGDSYKSKISKMDASITKPKPGMVFVIPYGNTGHTGFIVDIEGDQAVVKDSNYSLDEKVKTHKIPISKITGLRRV